ncbi:hypothetical protein LCGC14_2864880 [marine sediment metagenome]|uniref:Uncharacterized protein n=1 Tax=marine sediment metagenome TaxID=412755 RepID=A0A0F8Y4X0_9ZZZZ
MPYDLDWDERFIVEEDESGKFLSGTWFVIDHKTSEVHGPFNSEDQAVEAAGNLACDEADRLRG